MGSRKIRSQDQSVADASFGFVQFSLAMKRGAQIVVCLRVARRQGKRVAITSHRVVQPFLLEQQCAEIVVQFGLVRLEREPAAIAGLCLVEFILLAKSIAQIVVRWGQVRPQSKRLVVAGDRFVKPSCLMKRDSPGEYAPRIRRLALHHAATRFPRDLRKTGKTVLTEVVREGSYRPMDPFQSMRDGGGPYCDDPPCRAYCDDGRL